VVDLDDHVPPLCSGGIGCPGDTAVARIACSSMHLVWKYRGMDLYTYPITVEREGRKYYAYSEDFPGVHGLGKTSEEAKASIVEAMRIYIRECRARRHRVPRARTVYSETVSLAR
jgi:predicted RNase H-like HicB family nuclease